MPEQDDTRVYDRACAKLAENATETISLYEDYLMEKITWRELAKMMTKLRASVSAYYAAGGK